MVRTSYILRRWQWCLLCTRPTQWIWFRVLAH